jgi:hypothetical protein
MARTMRARVPGDIWMWLSLDLLGLGTVILGWAVGWEDDLLGRLGLGFFGPGSGILGMGESWHGIENWDLGS